MRARDEIPDHAKFFNAPQLARQTRNPEGLKKILAEYFRVPVEIDEFVSHWIALPSTEQTRLAKRGGHCRLGEDAVIGERVLDAQHKIQVRLGPMPLARYLTFLPGAANAKQVASWIRNYVGLEFLVGMQLVLRKEDAAPAQLGGTTQLGWTSWLGARDTERDADELVIDCC